MLQKKAKVPAFQTHAPCGWSKSGASEMDEYGAATAFDARPRIVVDFHDEIVQMIGAAQPIAWFIG